MKTDGAELVLKALCAAREAGEAILEVYQSDFAVELKNDSSPLTMADKRSHDCISRSLGHIFPIVSEEGKDVAYEERRKWDRLWLIDPLDGTREFIRRNGEFTVNIALIERERSVLGVIYVPVRDVFYFALEGHGAYTLGEGTFDKARGVRHLCPGEIFSHATRLSSSSLSDVTASHLTVAGSRSHATKELDDFVDLMKKVYRKVDLISAGSSLKFCLVAEGKAAIYPRFGPTMEWDTAAGQIIVEESGGQVLDMVARQPLHYNKKDLLSPWFIVTGSSVADIKW